MHNIVLICRQHKDIIEDVKINEVMSIILSISNLLESKIEQFLFIFHSKINISENVDMLSTWILMGCRVPDLSNAFQSSARLWLSFVEHLCDLLLSEIVFAKPGIKRGWSPIHGTTIIEPDGFWQLQVRSFIWENQINYYFIAIANLDFKAQ